jgi:hypothetical protein
VAEQPPTPPNPPRRPKRVSLKGRGADIFFGDYTPPGLEVDPKRDSKPSVQHDVTPSNQYDVEQERQHDDLLSRHHDTMQSEEAAGGLAPSAGGPMVGSVAEDAPGFAASQPATHPGAAPTRTPASRRARSERRPAASASPAPAAVSSPGANALPHPELSPEAWAQLDEPATIANTFRYTEEEVAALNDALYQIGKEYKVRVTKQDAVRLGLYLVLEDYRRRGLESLLGQLAESRQQLRRTGGR